MKRISILAASLALAASAQAATTVSSFSNLLQVTEINQTGALNLFDTNLGTLTDVEIRYTGSMSTIITLTNNAAGSEAVEAQGSVGLRFSSSLAGLNAIWAAPAPRLSLSVTTGEQNLNSGQTSSFGPLTDTESVTLNAALDGLFAEFSAAGGGTFNIGCRSLSGLALVGGGGNISATQATQAGCGAEVVYTYTERPTSVPEPGSLALVGLALAAAGFTASRRKA